MRIWRPKRGPVLTRGRAVHLLVGLVVPLLAREVWGYQGLGWASAVLLVGAVAWEVATAQLGRWFKWAHLFGDVVDLAAVAAGVVVAGLIGGL